MMKLMATPKSMDLDITTRCNLRCAYCSHFESTGDVKEDLALQEWLNFFEELNDCAVTTVTICGGEPFYRGDLKDIIGGIVRNRMRFSILSNGTLITQEMASFLASTRRCDSVQVSLDGSMPVTHDSARGEGSFVKAIEGIKNLQKRGVQVTVRVTIHKKNVRDLENIARLLLEDIGLKGFSTNSASQLGLCRKNTEDLSLGIEEQVLAMDTLLKLNKRYDNRISASAGPLANAKAWIAMETARCEGKDGIPGRGYLVSCGGVLSKLGVRADGVIVPCCQMSHIELGRINKDNLRDIWHNHPELKKMRERRDISLSEFDFCKGCVYLKYCAGGCPALSYTIAGDAYRPSPDACLRRFLKEGGRLPAEALPV
ncbi:MAG: SynChlorMet cassette radical SAM/SPASM protein ScmE [Candidatus Omnitrophica bacterium]|nr:SynChlorMet cassette radical SAM/SPASM protein ScmE [Candidatus Omnitrophota bacterium]